jgi:energy-coupling factor transporter ATP-binding protein EcfA2
MSETETSEAASPRLGTYFTELTVESVRCFGDKPQTLNLSKPSGRGPAQWTVILGNNGSGKTTLLQSIAAFSATDSWLPYGYWRLFERKDSIKPIGGKKEPTFRVRLQSDCVLNGNANGFEQNVSLTFLGVGPPNTLSDHAELRPICFGYGAWRRSTGISFIGDSEYGSSSSSGEPEDDGLANLYDQGHPLRNAEAWLLQLDYGAIKPSEVQTSQQARLEQVKELLVKLLPGVFEVRINAPTVESRVPSVHFRTDDGWVPLEWAGYGYRSTVAWVIDFASRMIDRYPESEDPLSEPAVVLVDEIDLHLHPLWQRMLMDHLSKCFPNTQFIVTAHSPLFVQAAVGANLVVLRRDEQSRRVIIDNDVDRIANWRIDQILTSDLFGLSTARPPQIERAMQLRKTILMKEKLDEADRQQLDQIERQIGGLPTGESDDESRVRELLGKTLKVLLAKEKKGGARWSELPSLQSDHEFFPVRKTKAHV